MSVCSIPLRALRKKGSMLKYCAFAARRLLNICARRVTKVNSAAARADAVILPLPVSRDGVRLNSSPLTLNELSDTLERGQTVLQE